MFWTDTEKPLVSSGAMDGSGSVTNLPSSGLNGPWAITLVRPAPPGDPYDSWKIVNFTSEDLAAPLKEASIWGDDADPDSDGNSNLLEYVQGSDPNSPLVLVETMTINTGEKVQLVLRVRTDDPALNSTLESTVDLASAQRHLDHQRCTQHQRHQQERQQPPHRRPSGSRQERRIPAPLRRPRPRRLL
jgi:hypothetical protein